MDGYDNKTVDTGGAADAGVLTLIAELVECNGRSAVTAASQAAVGAGIAMLARGGNAYDAALATAFMENVALPMKCGLGGDVVALVVDGQQPEALVSIGPGIAALAEDKPLELTGPTAIGIPGAPGGYAALANRARFSLADLVKPAIEAAKQGVQWSRIAVELTQEAEDLLRQYNGDNRFLPGGKLPRVGETFRLPGLAQLLGRFAECGAGLFQGEDGARLAARIRQAGGFMTAEDLSVNPAQWRPAVSHQTSGGTVWATPHPTHGEGVLMSLQATLDKGMTPVTAARFARQELRRQSREPADGGTSVVTAADDAGRHVVIVHSNSFPTYGSGVLVEEWDLVLNNRPGRGFTTNGPVGAANAPMKGRVPLTTLNAWAVRRHDSLYTGATPGGVNQAIWNLQTILECLEGKPPGAIVSAPRFSLDASDGATWEGNHPAAHSGGGKTAAILSNRSATQVILRNLTSGIVTAAADPRMSARAVALP